MRGPAFRRALHALGPLLLLVLAWVAYPQPAAAQRVESIQLTDVNGYAEVGVQSRREERSRRGETSFDRNDLDLLQILHVNTAGYVYHPRFLRFWLGTLVDLTQTSSQGEIKSDNREQLGGNWRLNFLDEHPYGLQLYGNVRESDIERDFARTYELTSSSYGGSFFWRRGPLPLQLSWTHRDRDGTGEGNDIDETGDEWSARSDYQLGESSRGKLEFTQTSEDIRGQDIDRRVFFATNHTSFDPEKRRRFTGTFRTYDQSDNSGDRNVLYALGRYDWIHSDRFSTGYTADFQHNDAQSSSVDNYNFSATARHRLFSSLRTTADGFTRLQDGSFGDVRRFGGRLALDYTKRLRHWGRLQLNLTPHAELRQNRPEGSGIARQLDDGLVVSPRPLLAVEVSESTLRDDGTTRVILVDKGPNVADPTCFSGLRIESFRVNDPRPGSIRFNDPCIDEESIVDVDYPYSFTRSTILTSGLDMGARLAYRDLVTFYYQRTHSDQDLNSGDIGNTTLEERLRDVFGIRWTRPWATARTEFEKDRSTFAPYRALSNSISLYTPPTSLMQGSVAASHRLLEYTDTDEDIVLLLLSASLDMRLGPRTRLDFDLEYRLENWSGDDVQGDNDLQGFEIETSIEWRFARFLLEVGGRFAVMRRDGENEDEEEEHFFVRARREF